MSTSNQKVIPVSDVPAAVTDQQEPTTNNQEFERLETEEEFEPEFNLAKLGEFNFEREWEKLRAKLTYDYFKATMRWFLESASIELTITVSVTSSF